MSLSTPGLRQPEGPSGTSISTIYH
uniref:Uncharacterized protein n=1 Tax=Anguilla anguilla TaxID=7936 RepID=A0A0E9TUJ2_ANGAN